MNRQLKLDFDLDYGKGNRIFIMDGEKMIGHATLVYDEKRSRYDGTLVFHEYLEEIFIFQIGKMIQEQLLFSDEEMFLETYFGVYYGLICDERPEIWERLINPSKN